MRNYLLRSNLMFKTLMPQFTWHIKSKANIYLTFDDGPHPSITPEVLALLAQYQVKATFFCVGENVQKYPDVFQQIQNEGHEIGNHTYNHLNGWYTENEIYLDNVVKANALIPSTLFRPPYGRIKKTQAQALLKAGYKIVMWTLLTGDFDTRISGKKCYENIASKLRMGDIIVFHDSEKAYDRLMYALPKLLAYCQEHHINIKPVSEINV